MPRPLALLAALAFVGTNPAASAEPARVAKGVDLPRPAVPSDWGSWRTEKIGEGVFAFLAPPGVTPIVSGNSLAILGDDAVLLVDTTQLPSIARQQIAALKKRTSKPVRFIVNTHWHPDHWLGNAEFLAAYPGATVLASRTTRALIDQKAKPFLSPQETRKTIEEVSKLLTSSKAPPPGSVARAYYELGVVQLRQYQAELEKVTLAYPTLTLDHDVTIHLGTRQVDVRFLGRGNTGGDLIVYLPDQRLVAAGDLVVLPYPYAIGSYIHEWPATLARLAALEARTLVPGHGRIQHDRTYLDTVIALLQSLESQVAAAVKRGATLEATRAALDSREKQRSVRCGPTRRPKTETPALATGDTAKSSEQPPLLASRESPASVAADPNEDALLPVRARASSSAVRPVADPQRVAEQVPGRPLLIAGGVTLSIGLALGGVAIYTGRRALAAYQAGLDLRAEVQGAPDAAMLARDADLAAEYRRLGPAALATAIGSGVAVITGVVMASVGGRRRTRAARTAWTPVPGGLALHVRF